MDKVFVLLWVFTVGVCVGGIIIPYWVEFWEDVIGPVHARLLVFVLSVLVIICIWISME